MSDSSANSSSSAGSGNQFVNAATSQSGNVFLQKALAQDGDTYVYGFEIEDLTEADPDTFDCAELVQWSAKQAGLDITDGSWLQYRHVKNGGGAMSVEEALNTPGALLFSFSSDPTVGDRPRSAHVAISLGDGRTIEARGSAYGVGIFDAAGRKWTHGGVIPELSDVTPPISPVVNPVQRDLVTGDSDNDGLLDDYEAILGTDPFNADTDGDGFIDRVELVDYGTRADDASSNPLNQGREAYGMEPIAPPEPVLGADSYVAPPNSSPPATPPPSDPPPAEPPVDPPPASGAEAEENDPSISGAGDPDAGQGTPLPPPPPDDDDPMTGRDLEQVGSDIEVGAGGTEVEAVPETEL